MPFDKPRGIFYGAIKVCEIFGPVEYYLGRGIFSIIIFLINMSNIRFWVFECALKNYKNLSMGVPQNVFQPQFLVAAFFCSGRWPVTLIDVLSLLTESHPY